MTNIDTNFTALEQAICPVCGVTHDTGVMIHKRLKDFDQKSCVTGYKLCVEHQKMYDDGFIALVAVDPSKSDPSSRNSNNEEVFQLHDVWRTGDIAFVKKDKWTLIFDSEPPDTPLVFIEQEAYEILAEQIPQESSEQETP